MTSENCLAVDIHIAAFTMEELDRVIIRLIVMLIVIFVVFLLYSFGVINEAQAYTIIACVATIVKTFI